MFVQLTHTIMGKEIKQCKSVEHLSCNEAVKHKTKDYVKKYMSRFGPFYKTESERSSSPKEHIVANDSNDWTQGKPTQANLTKLNILNIYVNIIGIHVFYII